MSETDDTDELLLIPPDFFQISPEIESAEPYFDVVDTLISQVNSLRGRVRTIEDTTGGSVIGGSSDELFINKQQMHQHAHGFNSAEDLAGNNSKGNSPIKEGRVAFCSLPSTPSTDRSGLRSYIGRHGCYSNQRNRFPVENSRYQASTRAGYNAGGVNNNSSGGASRDLSAEFDKHASNSNSRQSSYLKNVCTSSPNNSGISAIVDRAIKGGAVVTKLTVQAVREIGKNEPRMSDSLSPSPTSAKSRESMETAIYRYNPQAPRHLNFEDDHTLRTARNLLEVNKRLLGSSQYDDKTTSDGHSLTCATEPNTHTASSTSGTAHCSSPKTNIVSGCFNTSKPCCTCDTAKARHNVFETERIEDAFASGNLLSLSELFSSRQSLQIGSVDMHHVRNKLTEEKLRRLHCEQLLRDLQMKLLELEQKLSVALQIDKSKTDSIEQFQKIWTQIANRVQQIINDRNKFEQDLYDVQTRTVRDLQEAAKNVEFYENEATKASSLATKHHAKMVQNDAKIIEVLAELENCKSTIQQYEHNLQLESKKSMELSKIVGQKEIELHDSKKVLADARNEIAHSKNAIEVCQGEFTAMKSQCTDLELLLQNKEDALKHLESQKRAMTQDIEKLKNIKCKNLEEELEKTRSAMERNKNELRQFYQSQLEVVVQEKLTQFQKQLDQAESHLQMEMKNRERTIAETAAQHIQQLSNKHRTEIRLLEAKHSEQLRLQHLQLQQAQMQLHEQQERKQHIATQLHQMMEAQWREAVRIINSTKGANESECGANANESAMHRMERLHREMKDRSRSNLEEIFQVNVSQNDLKGMRNGLDKFPQQTHISGEDVYDQAKSKTTSSRGNNLIDADLQKCIDMLLNRPATFVAEVPPKQKERNSEMNTHSIIDDSMSSIEMFNTAYNDRLKNANATCLNQKSSKRPWK